jgi:hypothetical protein
MWFLEEKKRPEPVGAFFDLKNARMRPRVQGALANTILAQMRPE